MGGGAIRTAARAAVLAGQRSTAGLRPSTLPTSAAASTVHVAIDGQTAPLISSVSSEKNAGAPAMVQWPAWEIDDWEFAGGMEEEAVVLDPPPRLVFGPAPTLQEAEEATADLKEAIEK